MSRVPERIPLGIYFPIMLIDFALLGVFPEIQWQDQIHEHLQADHTATYWLPWGSRQQNLYLVLSQLIENYDWTCVKKELYSIYSYNRDKSNTLKFFHHESKKQNGDGKIHYRYDIGYVVIGDGQFSPQKILGTF